MLEGRYELMVAGCGMRCRGIWIVREMRCNTGGGGGVGFVICYGWLRNVVRGGQSVVTCNWCSMSGGQNRQDIGRRGDGCK